MASLSLLCFDLGVQIHVKGAETHSCDSPFLTLVFELPYFTSVFTLERGSIEVHQVH